MAASQAILWFDSPLSPGKLLMFWTQEHFRTIPGALLHVRAALGGPSVAPGKLWLPRVPSAAAGAPSLLLLSASSPAANWGFTHHQGVDQAVPCKLGCMRCPPPPPATARRSGGRLRRPPAVAPSDGGAAAAAHPLAHASLHVLGGAPAAARPAGRRPTRVR